MQTTTRPAPQVAVGVFDAPSQSEWAAFRATPLPARLYNTTVVLAALALTLGAGALGSVGTRQVATLAFLAGAGMANVELGRLAEGRRVERQRIHKGLSAWPFAAALLLGPGLAGWVAIVLYVHAWARGVRITLWKWIGSCAIVCLAALAACATFGALIGRLPADASPATLAGVAAAAAAFLAVEAGLLFVISRLNREADEVYLRAMLASSGFYLVELAVLAGGALAAVLYRYEPTFLLLAGPASMLMQRGLLHQALRQEASHDAKTGLLNSEAWRAAAALALCQARRDGRPVAVLIVDVDRFKVVNDTYGHLVGDDVLTRAAGAILDCVRRTDVVGRFGGDEFCALLACTSVADAAAAAERVCGQISLLAFEAAGLRVTASVGLAVTFPADTGIDLPGLIATADQALYQAKTAGRDRVCVRAA